MINDANNTKHCQSLIKLCSNLMGFPSERDVVALLVTTLCKHARSQDHAQRMITRWIEVGSLTEIEGKQRSVAPTVPDIIRMAATVEAEPVPVEGCDICNPPIRMDDGAVIHDGPHSHVRANNGGWMRCSCSRGSFLAAKDEERRLAAISGRAL